MSTFIYRLWFLNSTLNYKSSFSVLEKMADFRSGTRKVQGKPGHPECLGKGSVQRLKSHLSEHKSQPLVNFEPILASKGILVYLIQNKKECQITNIECKNKKTDTVSLQPLI